ncbi:hypothetical protein ASC61_01950 [Aeromicrobium sp. Root344]|uniref:hypothetical protein n=1 Tax=Aeromicrobium sp. Root344 TaxID=1736521 RepID=UPI0006F32E6F|nr:hypothetical protein [Aeromicrobium sp. Root344]KQV73869.1 hypothetical protein ASC61_01950 [Aeromicrobium sp. Root344]
MDLYFSQHFGVSEEVLEEYGAFDLSIVSDLPLFVDPFLLFNSEKPEYQELHAEILRYLKFLRSKADIQLDPNLINSLYRFKEVKQNWFGFTLLGNGGSGLGPVFAKSLHDSLGHVLGNFGSESITSSSHLEKLALIKPGVGRDNISDFTTNLIKEFLLEYTQEFARTRLSEDQTETFAVTRARFNYDTETWETRKYLLPKLNDDFLILTPADILTRDDTWISHSDMIKGFEKLPEAIPDGELRAQIDNYFRKQLGKKPTAKERAEAARRTIMAFPDLIDYYIKEKEDSGESAVAVSAEKVEDTRAVLVEQLKRVVADLEAKSDFYEKPWSSLDEARARVGLFKDYVENQDGYKLINRNGKPFSREDEVQLFFGVMWCSTDFDVNREPNNGRGPVDFKVSFGAGDKSLIEFKLASNSALKRNLEKQVEIYEKANKTSQSLKVIICYTKSDEAKVQRVLKELKLTDNPAIVVIDARNDNKPSASKA